MIHSYGLLWQCKYMHMGSGGKKGCLLGKRSATE